MIPSAKIRPRLQFLIRITRRQCQHLLSTDKRLFEHPFTLEQARQLETDPDLAERVEAFAGRFSRLQDTIGDKLLPMVLMALGEKTGAVIDNLDKAERLGFLESADGWITLRQLTNQMVHEYAEDLTLLASALQTGHTFVPTLIAVASKLIAEIEQRGWT